MSKKRIMGYVVTVRAVIPLAGGDEQAWKAAVRASNNMKSVLEEAGARFHTMEEGVGELQIAPEASAEVEKLEHKAA
jgi:hypothetical protein